MTGVTPVSVRRQPLARLEPILGPERYERLQAIAAQARQELGGATVWNVNSTAAGGGVAEMLRVLVGYICDAGIETNWSVVSGDPEFFGTTKRIHNHLHGFPGDRPLTPADSDHYRAITDALGAELAGEVRSGDVVLLHDPQTAGMARRLADAGTHVIWRCHIGTETVNEWTEAAWGLLAPHLEPCEAFVFSRAQYVPAFLPPQAVKVIPPSIDPFSPKNEELSPEAVGGILRHAGILPAGAGGAGTGDFTRSDGSRGSVSRTAAVVGEAGAIAESEQLVVQVSRWDRLKDMAGVMAGFVGGVPGDTAAHLALVGPATEGVSDDPEGAEVFAECRASWEALGPADRRRVSLVSLPMDDLDENAAMVNALQRAATVVVQKSLAEGFGLTVAEAMWKGRAVVASAVGGITDQVSPGTGVLLRDPTDLSAFGAALAGLLADPAEVAALGTAARARVLEEFVPDQHLEAYAALMHTLRL